MSQKCLKPSLGNINVHRRGNFVREPSASEILRDKSSSYCFIYVSRYLTEGQRHMLQRVLHRASSRGFTLFYYYLDTLAENAYYHLVKHSCCQAHCLYHLYTVKPRPPDAMQLGTHSHDFELLTIKYEFNKRNFIVQSLSNYV